MLAACSRQELPEPDTQVLVIGDSVLAWNAARGASISQLLQEMTGLRSANRAVPGARFTHSSADAAAEGYDIRAQYVDGPWRWVVLNGGANDLLSECGCRRCAATLEELIGDDIHSGEIPALARRIRSGGSRVLLLGYYDGNARPNVFDGCGDEIDVLNDRLARFAAQVPGVFFVSAEAVIDAGDQSHWFIDRVHPSPKGSRRIAALLADAIRSDDPG